MVKVGRLDLRTRGGGWGRGRARAGGLPELTGFSPRAVVADVLCEFLEVAVHLILYVREVYPVGIFQKRKKYNVPVQVSPHLWSPLSLKVDRGWMFELSSAFRLSPLTPQRPGLAFQFPATTAETFLSIPLNWKFPLPQVRDQTPGLELPLGHGCILKSPETREWLVWGGDSCKPQEPLLSALIVWFVVLG